MSVIATDVFDRARVPLNDSAAEEYTNAILLPVLKICYDEYGDILANNGISVQKEQAADVTVAASATPSTLSSPSDMVYPKQLFEKDPNDDDGSYFPIDEKTYIPNVVAGPIIRYWAYRELGIQLGPCTATRKVRLQYVRLLSAVTSTGSIIEVSDSLNYLSFAVAALAVATIGENPSKGALIQARADKFLTTHLGLKIKANQGLPARRLPFRLPRTIKNARVIPG